MRNGQTPIHIQRWAPADFHADETVKLLKARRDYLKLTFYRTFLDESFMAGGDLPADPESLAAVMSMPVSHVKQALAFFVGLKIFEENGRLYQPRIKRDVADELEFREIQRANGKKGGRKASHTQALPNATGKPKDSQSPPAPIALRLSPAPIANACADVPVALDTETFRSAWDDWLAYRKESKFSLWKPVTVKAKLAELEPLGPVAAAAAIRRSIANGWKGIFPETGNGTPAKASRDCDRCAGKGYAEIPIPGGAVFDPELGRSRSTFSREPCKRCQGSGKF